MENKNKTLANFKNLNDEERNKLLDRITRDMPDDIGNEKGNDYTDLPDDIDFDEADDFPIIPNEIVIHEVRDFVYYMIHNKNLTRDQQAKRDQLLATGRISPSKRDKGKDKQKGKKDLSNEHHPKKTADFLSLFNQRDGFKYLTHNYDNQDMDYVSMLNQVKKVFDQYSEKQFLPKSLITLLRNFIYGKEWLDRNGTRHQQGYFSDKWKEWSIANGGKHPITNIGGIESEIQQFRHTIRVVSPDLQRIFEVIFKEFPDFHFSTSNLDKADFYTNVYILRLRLQEIIKDLTDHNEHKEINISYMPNFDTDEYVSHVIRISQIGGYSSIPIEQALKKFESGGGFFSDNAQKSCGYFNWSVESYWDGKPLRWNILNDNGAETIEPLSSGSPATFTHILTFYSK